MLTGATHSGGGNESYSYDSNGNRTNTGDSTGTNNQLSSDGTYNYTYDNEGNLTKKTTIATGAYVTYTWDYHNRLTDVEAYNSSNVLQSHVHYTYDVFDRLIEEQIDPTGGGTYTSAQSFVYDDSGNIVLVYNGSGTLTDRLLNGPGANNALADENGSGVVSWLLADNEGSIHDIVQYNSGTNTTTDVDQITYGGFGNITAQTNSADQPLFAYTGQMLDAATGLYYYHARWYDASTGRFISQDPTGFAAGDANLYRYVGNSPTNLIDPTGTDSTGTAAMAQQMAQVNQQMQQAMQAQQAQQAQLMAQMMAQTRQTAPPPTDAADNATNVADPTGQCADPPEMPKDPGQPPTAEEQKSEKIAGLEARKAKADANMTNAQNEMNRARAEYVMLASIIDRTPEEERQMNSAADRARAAQQEMFAASAKSGSLAKQIAGAKKEGVEISVEPPDPNDPTRGPNDPGEMVGKVKKGKVTVEVNVAEDGGKGIVGSVNVFDDVAKAMNKFMRLIFNMPPPRQDSPPKPPQGGPEMPNE